MSSKLSCLLRKTVWSFQLLEDKRLFGDRQANRELKQEIKRLEFSSINCACTLV